MDMKSQGLEKVRWASKFMPVLEEIRERFLEERLFEGKKVGMCLHITAETAFVAEILANAGAKVKIASANPLSAQADIVEFLRTVDNIDVLGYKGMGIDDYRNSIEAVVDWEPDLIMDDGAELTLAAHLKGIKSVIGATEETASGYYKLLNYEEGAMLDFPVIATSFSYCHNLFDNRHGTSQSVIDGIIRATNTMLQGKTIVVSGYGQCGSTFAHKAKGMGANVVVTEVSPQRALEAALDGYRVCEMAQAAVEGDIFCTFTGNINVLRKEHFEMMKDNVILCNAGHYDVEIDLRDLYNLSDKSVRVREYVREFVKPDGKRINLLTEGRIVNMTAAEGHPAAVMDISFALQLLSLELFLTDDGTLQPNLYEVPEYIDESIAHLKLEALGIHIDDLNHDQLAYLENNDMADVF